MNGESAYSSSSGGSSSIFHHSQSAQPKPEPQEQQAQAQVVPSLAHIPLKSYMIKDFPFNINCKGCNKAFPCVSSNLVLNCLLSLHWLFLSSLFFFLFSSFLHLLWNSITPQKDSKRSLHPHITCIASMTVLNIELRDKSKSVKCVLSSF